MGGREERSRKKGRRRKKKKAGERTRRRKQQLRAGPVKEKEGRHTSPRSGKRGEPHSPSGGYQREEAMPDWREKDQREGRGPLKPGASSKGSRSRTRRKRVGGKQRKKGARKRAPEEKGEGCMMEERETALCLVWGKPGRGGQSGGSIPEENRTTWETYQFALSCREFVFPGRDLWKKKT